MFASNLSFQVLKSGLISHSYSDFIPDQFVPYGTFLEVLHDLAKGAHY